MKKIKNDEKEAEKIYFNKRKKLIMEEYEKQTIKFDQFSKDRNPNKISNFITPMYDHLANKCKKENPTKNPEIIELIYNVYLKNIFKINNPNNHHEFLGEMYDFLKIEKEKIHFKPYKTYDILKEFMNTLLNKDKGLSYST